LPLGRLAFGFVVQPTVMSIQSSLPAGRVRLVT
jgi:hypothetical protein